MQLRHLLGFAALTAIWGTTWLAIRVVVAEAPPITTAGVRFVVSALLLAGLAKASGLTLGWQSHSSADRRVILQLSLLMIAVPYALVFWAEQFISSGLAAILFSVHTSIVVLLESLRVRRNLLTGRTLAGILLAFAGVVIIFWPRLGVPNEWQGAAAMVGAAISSALATVLAKYRGASLNPIVSVTWQTAAGGLLLLLLGWPLERGKLVVPSLQAGLALAYLTVFGSCVTFVLYYWLLKNLTPVRLSTLAFLTPLVAVAAGWLALNETLGIYSWTGAAMALAGVWLLHSREVIPKP